MKFFLAAMLTVMSCSSWKQGDFEKEIKKSSEARPDVNGDKELLEKFEVQPVATAVPEVPAPEKKSTPLRSSPPIKKTTQAPVKVTKTSTPEVTSGPKIEAKSSIPQDYPAEMKNLNKKAQQVWSKYRPNHVLNQQVYLNINYLGMTVGKIMFTNKGKKMINNKEVWHLHARFKSAPFYSKIYELDDTVDTYVTADQFLSIRYSLVQRESKQDIDDLQLHDRDQLKTFWFYKQKKTNEPVKKKDKDSYIPYFSIDPFSVLFFYQGLPLNNGDVYEIPIINKAKILVLKSVVEGREVVRTAHGDTKAIRVHATTQYSGEHLKSGDLYFWFSDDEKRTLIKARAKIKIGSVTAEIVDG